MDNKEAVSMYQGSTFSVSVLCTHTRKSKKTVNPLEPCINFNEFIYALFCINVLCLFSSELLTVVVCRIKPPQNTKTT